MEWSCHSHILSLNRPRNNCERGRCTQMLLIMILTHKNIEYTAKSFMAIWPFVPLVWQIETPRMSTFFRVALRNDRIKSMKNYLILNYIFQILRSRPLIGQRSSRQNEHGTSLLQPWTSSSGTGKPRNSTGMPEVFSCNCPYDSALARKIQGLG